MFKAFVISTAAAVALIVVLSLALAWQRSERKTSEAFYRSEIAKHASEAESSKRSLDILLSERERERESVLRLFDTLRELNGKRQTLRKTIDTLESRDETIRAYLDTRIPDDLSVLLSSPFNRIRQDDAPRDVDEGLHTAANNEGDRQP